MKSSKNGRLLCYQIGVNKINIVSYPLSWTLRRPDGSVYGRKGYSSNNEFFWTDHLGSVRVRTSNSGSMLEAHDYYPFGLDMPGRSSAGLPMRQGFTGYWRDREGGLDLYYSGARMYSPGTGRFFGVDPLAEEFPTWSPYVYTFNNPVNWRDPDGQSAKSIRDILLLNRSSGAGYQGHNAILVGSDESGGWSYYSKDGKTESMNDHTVIHFDTLELALISEELSDYDRAVFFKTTDEQDRTAKMTLSSVVSGKYNFLGSNCADLCRTALENIGVKQDSKVVGVTRPNTQYDRLRSEGVEVDLKKVRKDLKLEELKNE